MTGRYSDKRYRGSQSKTRSGHTCMNWNSNTPHKTTYNPENNPEDDLVSNFCRNPSGDETVWCYTTNPKVRWEFCNEISETNEEGLWGRNGS